MNLSGSGQPRSFVESALVLLLLLLLIYALYGVLSVFFGVFAFALILAVSFSPLFEKMVKFLRNKRGLAAFVYALLLIGILAVPFAYVLQVLGNYFHNTESWIANAKEHGVPSLPDWITGLPFVGNKISSFWQKLQANPASTIELYEPQIRRILGGIISGGAGILGSALEFLLGIIISAIFLARSKEIMKVVTAAMNKLFGDNNGSELIDASGRAVKGVAIGVMGTAIIEAVFAWAGYAIAGISFAVGLAAITFFCAVIQVGPTLVWVPVAIWMGVKGETGWAIFVAVYGIGVLMTIDNILKPILIAKSGKLPVLILFLGVVGGMAAWGFTGMFKGAIVLAMFYTVFNAWLGLRKKEPEPASSD